MPALVIAGLLAAGCAGDSEETSEPVPEAGSARARATAQRLVNRHWRAVVTGDSALPLFYDERILRSIPAGDLGLALYAASPQFAVKPQVVAVERTPLGLSITTESRPDGVTPIRAGYLMRRLGTEWRILYDSNLAQGLDRLAGTTERLRAPPSAALASQGVPATYMRLRDLYLPGRSRSPLLRRRAFFPRRQGSG